MGPRISSKLLGVYGISYASVQCYRKSIYEIHTIIKKEECSTCNKKMKIAIILGTRPEIIKMSPIIRLCEKNKLDFFIIHTGQHYSFEMDKVFFENLNLPSPKVSDGHVSFF